MDPPRRQEERLAGQHHGCASALQPLGKACQRVRAAAAAAAAGIGFARVALVEQLPRLQQSEVVWRRRREYERKGRQAERSKL